MALKDIVHNRLQSNTIPPKESKLTLDRRLEAQQAAARALMAFFPPKGLDGFPIPPESQTDILKDKESG